MNSEQDLIDLFYASGIVKKGHWLLNSGRHSDKYINKNMITTIPQVYYEVNKRLLDATASIMGFLPASACITGPPTSGAIFASSIGLALRLPFVYPDKVVDPKGIVFQRDFPKIIYGKQVVLVEDITTTGKAVVDTIKAVNICGGIVSDVIIIWNRGATFDDYPMVRFQSLINSSVESFEPGRCRQCLNRVPLLDPKTGELA